jgi:membrane-associated phospholipid phosphatase
MAHPTGFFFKANASLRFRLGWLAVAVAGIVAAFLLDDRCVQWVLAHRTRDWAHVAGAFSRWGDWPELMVLGLAVLAIAWVRRARGLVHLLICMITASTLAGASANAVRLLSGRTRPNAAGIQPGWYGLWHGRQFLLRKNPFHAFPSGHTAAAFAFFGTAAWARRGWAWLFLVPAGAIGWSRIYLNAHHLSDVTVALFLGLLLAYVVWTRAGPGLARLVAGRRK